MTVTGKREDGHPAHERRRHDSGDGTIYVSHNNDPLTGLGLKPGRRRCGRDVHPSRRYGTTAVPVPPGCGNLEIHGTYSVPVTVGAENDLIIKDDVRRTTTPTSCWGCSPQLHPRVPPVKNLDANAPAATTATTTAARSERHDRRRDPVARALVHRRQILLRRGRSGLVTVHRSDRAEVPRPRRHVEQRRPQSGFIKTYGYDDRMRFRSPPKFVDRWRPGWQCSSTPSRSRRASEIASRSAARRRRRRRRRGFVLEGRCRRSHGGWWRALQALRGRSSSWRRPLCSPRPSRSTTTTPRGSCWARARRLLVR